MPSTYMELTNRLLRRLNEVEISESDFPSVRGVQATAKDAILDTVREINSSRVDWPFNAVETEQLLEIGVEEYTWPSDFTSCDWNSFQVQKDTLLNVSHKSLGVITREEWYKGRRDLDHDSLTVGKNIPDVVFATHGQGFGVSPSPNAAFTIKYRYYKNPDDLSAYDDQVTIPNKFDHVIIAGALYHMNLFKENAEGVAMTERKFKSGLQDMTNLFLPNPMYVYGGQINFGGGDNHGGYLFYRGGL